MQALPATAAPVVTSTFIPVVTLSFSVPDLTVESFTADVEQQMLDAVYATLPVTVNVQLYITNIRLGSLLFDIVSVFLDGNTTAAGILQATPITVSHALNLTNALIPAKAACQIWL